MAQFNTNLSEKCMELVEQKGSKEEINLKWFILILKFETAIQGPCYPINLNNQ